MADEKGTQVQSTQDIADSDLFFTVQDMATTPVTKTKTGSKVKSWLKTYFDTIYEALGGGGVVLIEDQLKASDGAVFDFTTIPTDGTYKHLQFKISARSAKASVTFDNMLVQVNSLSSAIYEWANVIWYYNGSADAWSTERGSGDSSAKCMYIPAATAPANSFGSGFLELPDYANANKHKNFQTRSGYHSAYSASGFRLYDFYGAIQTTSAISRVTFYLPSSTNFLAQSRISLYGFK